MSGKLSAEEVATLIRARRILKDKQLPKDIDVKAICEAAGISRKTGYQWAAGSTTAEREGDSHIDELGGLKAEYEAVKERNRVLEIENEGQRLAWEIHHVDELLAEKKKHYGQSEKEKAIRFLRSAVLRLREASRLLHVAFSALSDWNRSFDETMRPFYVPENRGKASKITIELVRVIVQAAEELQSQGRRLRSQDLTRHLREQRGVELSRKKVEEVLIANGLFAARTRKRRPRFYQSLRKRIPNGLVSLDGSTLTVWLDEEAYKFNVELGVDVKTFTHTAYSVGDTESSEEVIKVLEAHRRDWGTPLGVVCDHGSSNLSQDTLGYLRDHGIELLPAGPRNPKGNGTDEGAFSQLKGALGEIRLDLSSPRDLVRSVLEKLIALYVSLRNRIPVKAERLSPEKNMNAAVSEAERKKEQRYLQDYPRRQATSVEDHEKLDRLEALLHYHGITAEPAVLNRAQRSIKAYELKAIGAAEEIFTKTVNRHPSKKNLAYFFGILKRIQQERDDEALRRYCRERYNQEVMSRLREQHQRPESSHTVEGIVGMLAQAVKATVQFFKELAIRKAHEWTLELMASYRYPAVLKKKLREAAQGFDELSLEQREKVCALIDGLLSPKTGPESVTRIS